MDKYEQAECDIFMQIAHAKLDGTHCTIRDYLRSQFPEPQKTEGVRELVSKIRDSSIEYNQYAQEDQNKWIMTYSEAAKLITDFIQQRDASKWISVKERMPSKNDKVLVVDEYGDMCSSFFDGVNFTDTGYKITHWQPLPEPKEPE